MEFNNFKTKDDLFNFLIKNKQILINEKKINMKKADSVYSSYSYNFTKSFSNKEEENNKNLEIDVIIPKCVINTTGILDSHNDVHIEGIWKKSIKEQKNLMLIQEHVMKFDHIISDNVNAYSEIINWKNLGFNYEGDTEALIFESKINKDRNEYMFNQYYKGFVKNHSVGMKYVNLFLCINSEEKYAREERENWDKYFKKVVNKDVAEEKGWFWAVTEAKIVEGSAVVIGSNFATPVIELLNETKEFSREQIYEPVKSTQQSMFEKFKNLN